MSKKTTIRDIWQAKAAKKPLVCLAAYSKPYAEIIDAHADIILVGDTVGMVLYGMDSTLEVSLEMMIAHGKAVVRGAKQSFIVVDMPFATYQESKEQAFRNAARLLSETGADAVKLEGGVVMQETIAFLVSRGVPVMGHIGMMPQHVRNYGGYYVQGKATNEEARIVDDAKAVANAGAFSVVIEVVPEPLAQSMTESLSIPTIGIGASPACDGQILVTDDMVGLFADFRPSFVKQYGNIRDALDRAISAYASDVRAGHFPKAEHCFAVKQNDH